MNPENESNLVLDVIQYGMHKKTFHLEEMYKALNLDEGDKNYIYFNLVCTTVEPHPNHIIKLVSQNYNQLPTGSGQQIVENKLGCRILPTAMFSYIDHLEIIEARRAAAYAKEMSGKAHKLSLRSIWISSIIGGISLIVGLVQIIIVIAG